jgi:ATP-binding cassette subfamily B multidrug efflux pump
MKSRYALWKIIFLDRPYQRFLVIFLSFGSAVLGLSVPYFQKIFSEQMNFWYLGICVVLALFYLATNQLSLFVGQTEAVQAQKKISELIYKKNLELKPLTLQKRSVGEVVSIYSTDVPSVTVWLEQSLPYGLTTVFPLLLTPFFLNYFYEIPLILSLLFVGGLISLNCFMAYRQSVFFFRFKMLAAERMGLVNEWIQNIRGLKILNWIEGFEGKITKKRREETANRISMLTNGQIMNSISSTTMFWLNLSALGFLIWFSEIQIKKSDIVALLWVTTVFLSRPLRQLPWFFTFVFDAWTSFNRIADFLSLKNIPEKVNQIDPIETKDLVFIKNLNLYVDTRHVLKNISLEISAGEIVALVGPVGAGKSLLIKSLLRETPFTADYFAVTSSSYLPQEHFIMSASLRDNMNFKYGSGSEKDDLIMANLERAQFNFQLDRIEKGLDTTIGERGVNLSGGQKQRVSLGRQLMYPEKLLILDDPLSAVDHNTEQKMIAEFVDFKKSGGSVLLTTQRFSVLPFCDRIIFLRDGRIEFYGVSKNFLSDPEFQPFLKGLV